MFCKPRLLLLAFALAAGAVLVALLASTIGRAPVRPPLPNPNGYDDFIKAGEAVLGDVSDWLVLDHDGLRDLVSTNAEPLRLLRLGLTRHCIMPMESALTNNAAFSLTNNAAFRHLPGIKRLGQLLAAEGRLREMENQPAEAAQSYVDAIRYGNEMSRGGFLITWLVGNLCEKVVCARLAKLVPKLNPDEARAVLKDLEKLDFGRVTWAEVQQSEGRERRYELRKPLNPIMGVRVWWEWRREMQYAKWKYKNVVARERLLAAELALRCYQSERGLPPARLGELATNYLSHVPEDPFSGKPLIYRAQGTNWLLYSVGPDGVDDGGTPVGPVVGSESKGDLFFDSPL
jgi:hypothetical protein